MADSDRISFSISGEVIGSKKNEDEGDGPRRYSRKLCLDCGITDANLNPTVAKCVLRTSEISSGVCGHSTVVRISYRGNFMFTFILTAY